MVASSATTLVVDREKVHNPFVIGVSFPSMSMQGDHVMMTRWSRIPRVYFLWMMVIVLLISSITYWEGNANMTTGRDVQTSQYKVNEYYSTKTSTSGSNSAPGTVSPTTHEHPQTPILVAPSLNLELHNETSVLLIHIGKAGGTSLRGLLWDAREYCDEHDHLSMDDTFESNKTLHVQMCALSKVTGTKKLVHLNRNHALISNFSHVLITVRNPLQRLRSWYEYETYYVLQHMTKQSKTPSYKHRTGKRLEFLFRYCGYRTFKDLVKWGLRTRDITNENHQKCIRTAFQCISGEYPCFAHNFFNYEYYLEDIIQRLQRVTAPITTTTGTLKTDSITNNLRVDVIRTEHSRDDMNRTLIAWTGRAMTVDMDWYYYPHGPNGISKKRKSHEGDEKQSLPSTADIGEAVEMSRLCRILCRELVHYQTILRYASNLPEEEIQLSLQELDDQCGFSVAQTCGTIIEYRNIKETRKNRMCEPGGNLLRKGLKVSHVKTPLPPC